MTYFDGIPVTLKQTFSRVRRSSGLAADSYGDATFTEQTTTGYKGFFQFGMKEGVTVNIAGKEISYDAIVYTAATMLVGETLVVGTDLVEVPDVFRSADDCRDRAVSLRRRPDVDDLHAIGPRSDELEVFFDFLSRREASVVAHAEAEVRFRRRNLRGGLPHAYRKREQGDAKNADVPASSG